MSSLPHGPTNPSIGLLISHSHIGPLSPLKPIPSSTYKLCGDTDAFTTKSSLTTLFHEIRSHPLPESQNRTSLSSDSVFQLAEALAKVTQLQQIMQA